MSRMEAEKMVEKPLSPDDSAKNTERNIPVEKCMLGNSVALLPQDLCEEETVFFDVMSMETWENVLTDHHREKLKSLLPGFPENEKEEQTKALRYLFAGKNFKFGNPLRRFFKKLKDGYLAPEVSKVANLLRKASYHEYKHQQKCYFYNLLQNVLISRKKLLDAARSLPPNQPVKMLQFTPEPENTAISEVTRLRYFTELHEVREECAEPYTSSEDENYPESVPPKLTRKYRKQMHSLEAPLSPDMLRITSTLAPPHGIHEGSAWSLNCPLYIFEMTEERYREILLRHKQKQTAGQFLLQDHPELDVSNITLQDIIARTNLAKRPVCKQEVPVKKKAKTQETVEKKLKPASPQSELQLPDPTALPPQTKVPVQSNFEESLQVTPNNQIVGITPLADGEVTLEDMDIDIDSESEEIQSHTPRESSPTKSKSQNPSCFFSLVRDLFCDSSEQKLSAAKLDERIRIWIDGPGPQQCDWMNQQESWCDLAISAIKFLAGDLISILPENFVPYLDYKKKQQQWHWIGAGRDSEENLVTLCQHWLENKDDVSLDVLETCQGSPPPPRVMTDWSVRPTTEKEKLIYREQECIRYQKPHKAFTFQIHGYESVVGPVKGVYGKESGVNKAREHSLLVSDRPPFVTILSLVRDSAARLPNGEGTRADICELLKDSQYLAPALDQQIHAVVSGALDRLHYEKDPCVKYDVNRKLWIYLHRNRTEEEFERIHQAQAAAAKAKKAFQKTKMPRVKTKDMSQSGSSSGLSTLLGENTSSVNVDISNSGNANSTSTQSLSSPRGGTNQRSLGPTKQNSPRTLVRSLSFPVQSSAKTTPPVTADAAVQSNSKKQISTTSSGTLFSAAGTAVTSVASSTSPKHISPSILPQPQNEGSNSRPPSQGSVQSLPSPKTVIANVNAAQFVGVAPLQGNASSVDQSLPSPETTPTPPPVGIDMKPSSPAFVGQPPVLQPVINQSAISMCHTLTSTVSSVAPSLAKITPGVPNKRPTSTATIAQALSSSSPVQGFQTIVIKPDTGNKQGTALSTLPLLTTGSVASSGKTAVVSTKPVVARVMSGTQVVSLSNLVTGNTNSVTKGAAGAATFRIQGGNFVQPVVTAGSLNVLQATHLTAASSAKLPRLAVASQQNVPLTTVSSANTINTSQPKLITVTQGQLGILQATHLENAVSHDASVAIASDSKAMVLSPQKQLKTLSGMPSNSSSSASGQVIGKPTQTVVMTPKSTPSVSSVSLPASTTLPSVILASNSTVTSPTVVIATQGALRPNTQTYVMAAPGTTPAVVMAAASQQGIKGVTPLNVKTLQGIKVIPVPPAVGAAKGVRTQPLLARIIAPPTGVTLQPAGTVATVSTGLGQSQPVASQTGVNIVSGMGTASSHAQVAQRSAKTTAVSLSTSSQPVIVQVQTSTIGSHNESSEQ